jgi:hypothetical protein
LTEIYLCRTCSCQEILRMETPEQGRGGAPPWGHDPSSADSTPWEELTGVPALIPAMQSVWEWMLSGRVTPIGKSQSPELSCTEQQARVAELGAALLAPWAAGDEGRRVGAAYGLGRIAGSQAATPAGQQALRQLVEALAHPGVDQRRGCLGCLF